MSCCWPFGKGLRLYALVLRLRTVVFGSCSFSSSLLIGGGGIPGEEDCIRELGRRWGEEEGAGEKERGRGTRERERDHRRYTCKTAGA